MPDEDQLFLQPSDPLREAETLITDQALSRKTFPKGNAEGVSDLRSSEETLKAPSAPSGAEAELSKFIVERLAQVPTRQDLWRAVLLGMLGGAAIVESLALLFR